MQLIADKYDKKKVILVIAKFSLILTNALFKYNTLDIKQFTLPFLVCI